MAAYLIVNTTTGGGNYYTTQGDVTSSSSGVGERTKRGRVRLNAQTAGGKDRPPKVQRGECTVPVRGAQRTMPGLQIRRCQHAGEARPAGPRTYSRAPRSAMPLLLHLLGLVRGCQALAVSRLGDDDLHADAVALVWFAQPMAAAGCTRDRDTVS